MRPDQQHSASSPVSRDTWCPMDVRLKLSDFQVDQIVMALNGQFSILARIDEQEGGSRTLNRAMDAITDTLKQLEPYSKE